MGDCVQKIPGPAYAFGTLTGYVGHDYSKNRAPAYSLGLRTTPPPKLQRTPGPYNVGKVDRNGRYPYMGWTIESRGATKVRPTGPGPLDYHPKLRCDAPAFSLGLKPGSKQRGTGPSAADYYPQNYGTGPAFSIGMMARKPDAKVARPGPLPATPMERYKNKAPAYSLGLRPPPHGPGAVGPGPIYYPGRPCARNPPHAYSFGLKLRRCAPPLITYEDDC